MSDPPAADPAPTPNPSIHPGRPFAGAETITSILHLLAYHLDMRTAFLAKRLTTRDLDALVSILDQGTSYGFRHQDDKVLVLAAYTAPGGHVILPGAELDLSAIYPRKAGEDGKLGEEEIRLPLLIPDTKEDPNHAADAFTSTFPGVRSYLAVPIPRQNGHFSTIFCALDRDPRPKLTIQTEIVQMLLRLLATQIEQEYERIYRGLNENNLRREVARLENHRAITEAYGRLVSFIAHEFATPLTAIVGFSGVLSQELVLDGDQQRYLNSIQRAAISIRSFFRAAFDHSRFDSNVVLFRPDWVALNAIVEKVATKTVTQPYPQDLILDLDSDLPVTQGDKGWLESAVQHVIASAVDYTPLDQSITIRTSQDGGEIQLTVDCPQATVTAQIIEGIFEGDPEADAQPVGPLGAWFRLATVRKVMALQNGRASATTQPNGTLIFHLTLPIAGPQEQATTRGDSR